MHSALNSFFAENKIEYYSVIDYADCREINHDIMIREPFEPRSVIMFLIPYYTGKAENLSVYAASLDYHIIIRELTGALIDRLSTLFPEYRFRGYGDHSPIDERHAALIAGLGIAGDSGLLINEKYGTYTFIADVVTDVPPHLLGACTPIVPRTCMHCGACLRACPTGILRGDGGDCLSAITQRKGELTEDEKALMIKHNILWGCDFCQSSCPHNKNPKITPVEFFHRDRIPCLTREILDNMSDDDFEKRAFAWRKRKTIERNLDILYNE